MSFIRIKRKIVGGKRKGIRTRLEIRMKGKGRMGW